MAWVLWARVYLGDLRAMAHGDHGVIASIASAMLWLEKNSVTFGGHLHRSLQFLGTAKKECAIANAGDCSALAPWMFSTL